MAYTCYLSGVIMPETPGKLTVKIKNKNKTVVLLNEGEINFLRSAGLTEITTTLVFPMLTSQYTPDYYLGLLEKLKNDKKPFTFALTRRTPDGKPLYNESMQVSLEDYNIVEDAKAGLDVSVDVSMKKYRDYACELKTVEIEVNTETQEKSVEVMTGREENNAPSVTTYTIQKGDTLWAIAKKYYGNGVQYNKIFEANKNVISNPNRIYPGQVITIP